ncbi:TonB-dependent receptor plug [Gloeocapsa sp. PCC 7428]|nr:TonB-dependent receptor plug [Gloeocapsa sp. PCC 7428]
MRQQYLLLVLGISVIPILVTQAVRAEVELEEIKNSHRVSALQRDRTLKLAQAIIQVTSVQVYSTDTGVEVVLETPTGALSVPTTQTIDNTLIAEIPNAVLVLPDANEFQATNPIEGITAVMVRNITGSRVQVTITGLEAPLVAEVSTAEQALILSVTPTSELDSTTTENEPIEIVVTATRTEEELQNVPRSVTVLERDQIQEQARFGRDLADILTQLVPGSTQPTGRPSNFTLRGRDASIVIDGIPQNTNNNQTFIAPLASIDPEAIDRIEIIRGPNAIYGGQATGGLINIITRRPTEDRLTSTVELGTTAAAGGGDSFLIGDSFGYNVQYSLSGTEGAVDWLGSLASTWTGGFFDAEGDRVGNNFGLDDTNTFDGLVKLGVNLDEQQRLQLTFNHYNLSQDTDFISDESIADIPGIQTARLVRIPPGTTVIGSEAGYFYTTTNTTLSYSHENLLGSRVQSQLFYRLFKTGGGIPFDERPFSGTVISNSRGETEQWGGRVQIETPFNSERTASLLWGVDYVHEDISQNFDIFDPEELDASGGLIYRKIDEALFIPPYTLDDLGIFAQLQWQIGDRITLNSGARYVNLTINTEDYTTFDDGRDVEGGTINTDDIVFNAGAVYNFTDALSVFASFAQGFSLPDVGRILRRPPEGFASLTADLDITSPQKVDNYELGIRGVWNSLQASLAGFYNYSSLGLDLVPLPGLQGGAYRIVRAPQRVYGVEATIDWQADQNWRLGGSASWQEGENDEDEDGEFLALNSTVIAPFKLTAYVEHETLPGWRNRLQLLYSGSRSRAFEDGVEGAAIESYVTVDYFSSISLFGGELLIGIQNLFNADYFPVFSQYFAPIYDPLNYKGQGRTISASYRITF